MAAEFPVVSAAAPAAAIPSERFAFPPLALRILFVPLRPGRASAFSTYNSIK